MPLSNQCSLEYRIPSEKGSINTNRKSTTSFSIIGVDLAGLLGGRMASAEGGSVPSGVEYGKGCPLFSRLRGLGERRELSQRGPGQIPGRKPILAYFEGHRTLIFVLI